MDNKSAKPKGEALKDLKTFIWKKQKTINSSKKNKTRN